MEVRVDPDAGGAARRQAHGMDTNTDLTTGATNVDFDTAPAAEPTTRPAFRLRRSKTDRMLGGVCGGLAESLGIDATLIRIGLVALTLLGAGVGVVLYVAVWALAPETDTP